MTNDYRAVLTQHLAAADNVTASTASATVAFFIEGMLENIKHRDAIAATAQVLIENLRPTWEFQTFGDELRERVFDLMDLIAQHHRASSPLIRLRLRERVPYYVAGTVYVLPRGFKRSPDDGVAK